jgi:hypothetical protein
MVSNMRVVRLMIGFGILACLLGAGFVGCTTSRQPTWTLEQWEAAHRAAGVGLRGGE